MKHSNVFILSVALCLLAAVASISFGQVTLLPEEILQIVSGKQTAYRSILLYSRLPRTLACLLAGAALSVSGAVLQRVLANKLASPGIIGVNAGAGLGVTVCCAAGVLSGWAVSFCAFCGSFLAVAAVTLLAYSSGASKTTVILSGVALNSIFSALTEAVAVLKPEVAVYNLDFRVGGFSSVSYGRVLPAALLIISALGLLFTLCNELDVISLGDETAGSLGLPVKRYRLVFLLLASVLAGAAVSYAGLLGFVGLIVPHFAAKLAGTESRRLLPVAAVSGAGLVTVCDLMARLVFRPYELPVGILMSVIGGPVFVILLLRTRGGHRHA